LRKGIGKYIFATYSVAIYFPLVFEATHKVRVEIYITTYACLLSVSVATIVSGKSKVS
jgi:hypothetical protein